MTAADLGLQLSELAAERRFALATGMRANGLYMQHLDGEIAAVHASYIGLAVTEIASLRAVLGGPLHG
jgi:hypothetical protein